MQPERTRFAPSPTGSLHVGGARTALYCLLLARRTGGQFVLRIEDTDQARSSDAAARGIVDDLRWLDLQWDEGPEAGGDAGPYFQSQRLELYDRHLQQLLARGRAYEAWESREELDALRAAAVERKEDFVYRQHSYSEAELERFRTEGRTPVVRLRMPAHDLVIHDEILGEVVVPVAQLEDLVIRKADGFPTYHFAVVVDDHHMGVTLVLRGQEHLGNTPKHLAIYEALGWTPPRHAHVPLIMNLEGGKMSKRDKAKAARAAARERAKTESREGWQWLAEATGVDETELAAFMKKKNDSIEVATAIASAVGVELPDIDVLDFRRHGILAEALVNYLALLGWSPGDDREILEREEMEQLFSLERVGKTAARFDPRKLSWLSGETIRRLPLDRLLAAQDRYFEVVESPLAALSREHRERLLEMFRPRIETFFQLDEASKSVIRRPESWDEKAVGKHLLKGDGVTRLEAARSALASAEWTAAGIEAGLSDLAESLGVGMGKVAQPVRIAVTGGPVSPGIGETLEFLPRDEVLARIDACLEHVASR